MLTGALIQIYLHTVKSSRLLTILLQAETCSCLKRISLLLFDVQVTVHRNKFL